MRARGMIYTLYIFGRGRKLLCQEGWNRSKTLCRCRRGAEVDTRAGDHAEVLRPGFFAYSTTQYKLHAFGTLIGYRFVFTTDVGLPDQHESLRHIYAELFVEHVIKTPLYT